MNGKIEAGIFKVKLNLYIFQCPVNFKKNNIQKCVK